MLEKVKLTGRVPATGGADISVATDDIGKMSEEQLDQLPRALSHPGHNGWVELNWPWYHQ